MEQLEYRGAWCKLGHIEYYNGVNTTITNVSNLGTGAVGGSDPNSATAIIASIAGLNTDGTPDLNTGLSQFGTGRLRRFAPDSSGLCNPLCDTGQVNINGSNTTINSVSLSRILTTAL